MNFLNSISSTLSTPATTSPSEIAKTNTASVSLHVSRRLGQLTCRSSCHEFIKYFGISHPRTLLPPRPTLLTGRVALLSGIRTFFIGLTAVDNERFNLLGFLVPAPARAASARSRTVGAVLRIRGFLFFWPSTLVPFCT